MALFRLEDCDQLSAHIEFLTRAVLSQRDETLASLRSLGYVVPTRTFFEGEERRYSSIFSFFDCGRFAAHRELLQNSSDAKTTIYSLTTVDLTSKVIPETTELEATNRFIMVQDSGEWCPREERGTYEKCFKYFLTMNGSSKNNASKDNTSKSGLKADGGFGVGRLVILFCAPLWMFTARHMLVIGHFNSFKILCRRCFQTLNGQCSHCNLDELETPLGTTFLINYAHFKSERDVDSYCSNFTNGYYRFCGTSFSIQLNGVPVDRVEKGATIYRGQKFTVSRVVFPDNKCLREVASLYGSIDSEDQGVIDSGVYMIRTALGIFMFTRTIHSEEAEKGIFFVDLDASITFKDFDQSRQTLLNDMGNELSDFLAKRSTSHTSHNIDMDHQLHIEGHSPFSGDDVKSMEVVQAACERPELSQKRRAPVQGLVQSVYQFRDGKTEADIKPLWQPGKSWEQCYVLMLWAEIINLLLPSIDAQRFVSNFKVGFCFSSSTEALMERKSDSTVTFFINPELLVERVGKDSEEAAFKRENREALVAFLLSDAIHEVTHLKVVEHCSMFASVMTDLTYSALTTRVREKVLDSSTQIRHAAQRIFIDETNRKYEEATEEATQSNRAKRPRK